MFDIAAFQFRRDRNVRKQEAIQRDVQVLSRTFNKDHLPAAPQEIAFQVIIDGGTPGGIKSTVHTRTCWPWYSQPCTRRVEALGLSSGSTSSWVDTMKAQSLRRSKSSFSIGEMI